MAGWHSPKGKIPASGSTDFHILVQLFWLSHKLVRQMISRSLLLKACRVSLDKLCFSSFASQLQNKGIMGGARSTSISHACFPRCLVQWISLIFVRLNICSIDENGLWTMKIISGRKSVANSEPHPAFLLTKTDLTRWQNAIKWKVFEISGESSS